MASITARWSTTVGRSVTGPSVPTMRRDARTINHASAVGTVLGALRRRVGGGPRPPPPADVDGGDPHADDQRQRRPRIQEERRAPGAWFGQHALPELPHEIVEDLIRALSRLQLLADGRLPLPHPRRNRGSVRRG